MMLSPPSLRCSALFISSGIQIGKECCSIILAALPIDPCCCVPFWLVYNMCCDFGSFPVFWIPPSLIFLLSWLAIDCSSRFWLFLNIFFCPLVFPYFFTLFIPSSHSPFPLILLRSNPMELVIVVNTNLDKYTWTDTWTDTHWFAVPFQYTQNGMLAIGVPIQYTQNGVLAISESQYTDSDTGNITCISWLLCYCKT